MQVSLRVYMGTGMYTKLEPMVCNYSSLSVFLQTVLHSE